MGNLSNTKNAPAIGSDSNIKVILFHMKRIAGSAACIEAPKDKLKKQLKEQQAVSEREAIASSDR